MFVDPRGGAGIDRGGHTMSNTVPVGVNAGFGHAVEDVHMQIDKTGRYKFSSCRKDFARRTGPNIWRESYDLTVPDTHIERRAKILSRVNAQPPRVRHQPYTIGGIMCETDLSSAVR